MNQENKDPFNVLTEFTFPLIDLSDAFIIEDGGQDFRPIGPSDFPVGIKVGYRMTCRIYSIEHLISVSEVFDFIESSRAVSMGIIRLFLLKWLFKDFVMPNLSREMMSHCFIMWDPSRVRFLRKTEPLLMSYLEFIRGSESLLTRSVEVTLNNRLTDSYYLVLFYK